MRFFLSIATFASLALFGFSLVACTSESTTAGIEIGNPEVADKDTVVADSPAVKPPVTKPEEVTLPLTAGFSVDYSDPRGSVVMKKVMAKAAADDEPMLLDSFAMSLISVRTYASYYVFVAGYDAEEGKLVWPSYGNPDAAEVDSSYIQDLSISFTKASYVDDAFKNIDLLDGGYLKEIGVTFIPDLDNDIYGRVLVDGKYVRFVYDMSMFRSLQLRYHYSQIEIDSVAKKANLSVGFCPRLFAKDLDFSKAAVSEDGVIYIDVKNNVDLWSKLNERFVSSFQPLRYDYTTSEGVSSSAYVENIWKDLAAGINENTIINGSFDSPFTTDWILVEQFGGKADTALVKEKNGDRIMTVDVSDGGDSSFSVQLLQENVALIEGVKYKCVFTIWSDVADSITARIGSYATYKTIGFSKHVAVGTTGKSVEIEFTPDVTDPFARFELNLGKKKRKFWLKDVQVLRLSK